MVYLIAILVFCIDIISKLLISNLLIVNHSVRIVDNFFYITYVKNTGIAFSMLEGNILFIVIMTMIVIFFLIKYINSKIFHFWESLSYGMIIGGAVGNLFDRLINGYVIDFFDFYIFSYDFPIFNIADIAIVVGILLVFFLSIIEGEGSEDGINSRKKRKN